VPARVEVRSDGRSNGSGPRGVGRRAQLLRRPAGLLRGFHPSEYTEGAAGRSPPGCPSTAATRIGLLAAGRAHMTPSGQSDRRAGARGGCGRAASSFEAEPVATGGAELDLSLLPGGEGILRPTEREGWLNEAIAEL